MKIEVFFEYKIVSLVLNVLCNDVISFFFPFRQSANENAVLSSDSEEVAEMSPFTSAFAASVLQDGEVTPEVVSSQTPSTQPKTQVTMSELIRKKKEQDLANSLGNGRGQRLKVIGKHIDTTSFTVTFCTLVYLVFS